MIPEYVVMEDIPCYMAQPEFKQLCQLLDEC